MGRLQQSNTAEIQFIVVGDDAIIDSCIELSKSVCKLLNFGLLTTDPSNRGSSSSNDNNWKVVWTKNQIITTEGFV
jgi:hypothetical protein